MAKYVLHGLGNYMHEGQFLALPDQCSGFLGVWPANQLLRKFFSDVLYIDEPGKLEQLDVHTTLFYCSIVV